MRLKIIAGNVIAVLLVGLGSYFYVKGQLEEGLGAQIDEQIDNDARLLQRSWRLSALEFTEQVRDRAETREVRTAFNALDQESRRRSAFERAEGIAAWFQDPARGRGGRPDIVLITDETGRVIARDNDINRMNGTSIVSQLPSLRRVLERGLAVHDVWHKEDDDKLLQVAIAPVRNAEGGQIGALLVGYDISNGLAEREADVFGHQVAFLREGGVYSSSLEQSEVSALSSFLFETMADDTAAALGGGSTSPWTTELNGATFVGVAATLPDTPSEDMAIAILANRTEQMALAETATVILILMAVGLIFVLIYGFLIGTSLIRPIEEIEEGVLTVINGRTDHRIDIESAEFGGLAYRINQLINVFTGVEETDAEGRSSGGHWEGAAAPTTERAGGGGGGGGDDAAAQQLAAEPEEQYRERIYNEYVAAKQAAGEDVSNIGKDRFLGRLEKNAQNLQKKHGCRMVRFEVQTKGSQVILKPVIIN